MSQFSPLKSIKGAEFIINSPTPESIFTPEDFSEEQKLMRDSAMEFTDKEIWPLKPQLEKKDYALTEKLMKKAGDLGFLGISVPEAYGGMGMGFVSGILMADYISGATGSFATAFGAHTGIGTLPISLYGTEEQKKKYLPKLATGEWFGAYCLTEPGAGSDANSGKTKAVLSEDGKYYKITGGKMWISNAGFCNLMIVFARIEDDKYITGFIVENDAANGISMGEEEQKLGIHASSTRQVFFNETKVPVENMLSERGNGFKIAMNVLNTGRIKLAAATLDAQRRVIVNAENYAKERKQFGKSIIEFGAIRSKLAEMHTSLFACESAVYRVAQEIESQISERIKLGTPAPEAELKSVEDFAVECSILKVVASEAIQTCADEGIQIYGGMGFSKDTPMEAAWRDARITRIYEGTNEINSMLAMGMLFKKAMKGQIDLLGASQKLFKDVENKKVSKNPDDSLFSEEKSLIKNLKKLFLMLSGSAAQKYGRELEEQQHLLLAAAEILIKIHLSESALLRAEKNIKKDGEHKWEKQIAMARFYLYRAVKIIRNKAEEAILCFARGAERDALMDRIYKFTNYQTWPNPEELRQKIMEEV